METIEYTTRILPDGHLPCPGRVKKHLHLTNGSRIKVQILPVEQKRIAKLRGIWRGIEIDAEDIAAARQEMWGKLTI